MTGAPPTSSIDVSRRFMPDSLTPLYYTTTFSRLSAEQRLRYNQLHAGYVLEQTIFFESVMARQILRYYASCPLPDGWAEGLLEFIAEEERHSEMFRALNRRCAPQTYARHDFHFIRVPAASRRVLEAWVRHPGFFPFFLWLMLLEEERSLYYASQFTKAADLEPNFVAAQKLIWRTKPAIFNGTKNCWIGSGRERAAGCAGSAPGFFNGWLANILICPSAGTPGARRVGGKISCFASRIAGHDAAGAGPGAQPRYHLSTYSRMITPQAFRRFDACPEFRSIGKSSSVTSARQGHEILSGRGTTQGAIGGQCLSAPEALVITHILD
jgi:hypothetical protein